MTIPIRVQRKRTKGWRMPENTVCVTRGTPLGNGFIVGQEVPAIFDKMYIFDKYSDCPAYLDNLDYLKYVQRGHLIEDTETAIRLYEQYLNWLQNKFPQRYEYIKEKLKDKNLACFCPLNQPCHADILLKIANEL